MPKFLREQAIEPNSRQRYAEVLRSHAVPYLGHRRVAEISRETFHRLLTVVLKDEGVGQPSILYARTALSAMMQMAWDHGYREDNPLRGIRLKGVPGQPIVVATSTQFQRVYDALPHQPAKVDLERVRYRLGHGDLTTTTRDVKILDEEDSTTADAIATTLGDVA